MRLRFIPFVTLALLVLPACQQYQVGFIQHPQIDTIAVGPVENRTSEPALGTVLRAKLAEQFMRDGSIKLEDYDGAEVVILSEIVGWKTHQIAAARAADPDDLSDYQREYRSSAYRAVVVARYRVIIPAQKGRTILTGDAVTGEADFPNTPDMETARSAALEQAANDAARQIVAAVTEAW